jgi:hypothetical protein
MVEWALSNLYSVVLVLTCLALITIVLALNRARRAEIVRLQNEIEQLSLGIRELQAAEQRRFLLELKAIGVGAGANAAKANSEVGKGQSTAA